MNYRESDFSGKLVYVNWFLTAMVSNVVSDASECFMHFLLSESEFCSDISWPKHSICGPDLKGHCCVIALVSWNTWNHTAVSNKVYFSLPSPLFNLFKS